MAVALEAGADDGAVGVLEHGLEVADAHAGVGEDGRVGQRRLRLPQRVRRDLCPSDVARHAQGVGEGAKPQGGALTIERRIADSPEPIRLGGVAHVLRDQLQAVLASEVRATVLGHVQRGGSPTPFDRVLATQFGNQAAQLVMEGRFNHMVTLQGGQLGSIPLSDVAKRHRNVPLDHPLLQAARQIGVSLGEP